MAAALELSDQARARLRDDAVAWLTTVRPEGQPQSSVIWFWWQDDTVWVRSQPGAAKVRNLRDAQQVALNLDSDGKGGDVVTLEGTATIVAELPDAVRDPYLRKYDRRIRDSIGTTPDAFLADYSTTIRIDVTRARAW